MVQHDSPRRQGAYRELSTYCESDLGCSQALEDVDCNGGCGEEVVKQLKGSRWARGSPLGRESKANRVSPALLGKCALLVIAI